MIRQVEILGPAGSGKTTLRAMLSSAGSNIPRLHEFVDTTKEHKTRLGIFRKSFIVFQANLLDLLFRPGYPSHTVSSRTRRQWINHSLTFHARASCLQPGLIGVYDEGTVSRALTTIGMNAKDWQIRLWFAFVPLPSVVLFHDAPTERLFSVAREREKKGSLPRFMMGMTREQIHETLLAQRLSLFRLVSLLPSSVVVVDSVEKLERLLSHRASKHKPMSL